MSLLDAASLEAFSLAELREVVGRLVGEVQRLHSDNTPDPVQVATEGALWGAICHHGLLPGTVIVSDGARQFRMGTHALCRVGGDVTIPTPHSPGRADFPHPVLHERVLLAAV